MSVTACMCGSHDFVLLEGGIFPAPEGMHTHECSHCQALYMERGTGPCWRCRKEDQ